MYEYSRYLVATSKFMIVNHLFLGKLHAYVHIDHVSREENLEAYKINFLLFYFSTNLLYIVLWLENNSLL